MGYSPWGCKELDTTEATWQQGQYVCVGGAGTVSWKKRQPPSPEPENSCDLPEG